MPTTSQPDYSQLDVSGFVLVPNFLSGPELDMFRKEYGEADRAAKARADYPSEATRAEDGIDVPYKVQHVSAVTRQAIQPRLEQVAKLVAAGTTIRVNRLAAGAFGSTYFATDGDTGLNWHQDSVSYYAYQNHHDYLNFYIPIIKPERARSNLCVVPFDALSARSPELCARLRGQGATRFSIRSGRTVIHDNAAGGKHGVLPYSLEEIAVTPELAPGDLLLLRGDVIHRTQDTATRRVSVSLRMLNDQRSVRRDELLRGSLFKLLLMVELRRDFTALLACFEQAGRDELCIGELLDIQQRIGSPRVTPSRAAFARFLLWNKLRLGMPGALKRSASNA